ncbi:hypothetical protein SSP24_32900 [Streptomyces spinoverrucosus]|uniref:Luciferase-like domain-containing protein n=1 Tax=Streptomyces spinoverrucosus TaxID=284043 RepID=A0A4Y3VHH0_9ACTN|nr:hypothetical protein SSP24_32900 [Streptomyces spinoverrucosus]GHB77745.1 hypothetical protein GCM10010397_55410 [Streptomyces spinoverrucosus]
MPGSTTGALAPVTAEELDERVATYRRLAEGRKEPAELNVLIQMVAVTEDREGAVRPMLPHVPHLSLEQALELPILLTGTLDEIVDQVRRQRERYGFSYLTVLEPYMEAFAPVIAALRGE